MAACRPTSTGGGLGLKPFVGDIESFKLVSADGQVVTCSRLQNSDLFKLAIGGYSLFVIVSSVTLRLMQRQKLQRVVELVQIDDVMQRLEQRIAAGFLYGDCQFVIDPASEDFLRRGMYLFYRGARVLKDRLPSRPSLLWAPATPPIP